VHSVQHGHWAVIENANLCNPSILDRLNGLFEEGT
jgi:midasin